MQLTALTRGEGSEIRLTALPASERPSRGFECWNRYWRTQRTTEIESDVPLLPELLLPPDLRSRAGLGAGTFGFRTASSEAQALTEQPLADVVDYVAEQLTAAGWGMTEGGADPNLVWSRWAVPRGAETYRGWLLATRVPGTQRVTIEVRAEPGDTGDDLWFRGGSTSVMTPLLGP